MRFCVGTRVQVNAERRGVCGWIAGVGARAGGAGDGIRPQALERAPIVR